MNETCVYYIYFFPLKISMLKANITTCQTLGIQHKTVNIKAKLNVFSKAEEKE